MEKPGKVHRRNILKSSSHEVLSNLVHGLWRNGFGPTDGQTNGQKDRRTDEAATICSPFGGHRKATKKIEGTYEGTYGNNIDETF